MRADTSSGNLSKLIIEAAMIKPCTKYLPFLKQTNKYTLNTCGMRRRLSALKY